MAIKVVDLFSGAGGLTLGFRKKIYRNKFVDDDRFKFVFANEFDPFAAESFRTNFPDITMLEEDIGNLDLNYLKNKEIDLKDIDLIIGGPPCQSFSTVGKRQYDNRAKMYKEYRRVLAIVQPKMFIFENVLGLLTMKTDEGRPVINDVLESFENFQDIDNEYKELGYKVERKVLNAKDFGVPQSRERVFLVGIRNDINVLSEWKFPTESKEKPLTIAQAIGDLPPLENGEENTHYSQNPYNKYQRLMRGNTKTLENHINSNNGERMRQIMAAVVEGEGREYINKLVTEGKLPKELYLTSGYSNTYGRLWWNKPSTTITNNLSTPSALRCIHPKQDRALTPREGARLQSFPDSFKFIGPKTRVNVQVGNAVPPLLGHALANSVCEFFKNNFDLI
ncbi:DNA cytosine methyltransferase [Lactococcus lactis]|uniref:DNA cytosine methyltransferase n=1 Tax=Lactococcus lactis TaxID=1358 RepID=UPI0022E39F40|nr:DNA cytosine methyltransferase [Lactococcus lactis]